MISKLLSLDCYEYKYLTYPRGVYDSFVDITYIITMSGSERSKQITKKLERFHPTSKICIVYNKGYKKCNKFLMKQNSGFDLSHAYFNIFYQSLKKKEENIMILEDDFEFELKTNKDPKVIQDIQYFFQSHKNESFIYNLGAFSQLSFPFATPDLNHYRAIYSTNTQAVIYTRKVRYNAIHYFFTLSNPELISFDGFISKYFTIYFYKYPITYQLFPETENSKLWGNLLLRSLFKITNLEKEAKPGFPFLFYLLVLISYLFFIAFFILIVSLIILTLYTLIYNKKPF
jgi:hypothetical protein